MSITTPAPTTAWNLHADQRPARTRVARTTEDVVAAFAEARAAGLRVAPQTTGHFAGALPALDDALLLRLDFADREVEVDPVARCARIPAGAVWDDVVAAVTPHGLAAMHGSSPTVGVVGYLLGGGLSFYGRAHGLAANHVRSFEVITPAGELRRASAGEHPELFWALRGGGGGYGVVTAVEIDLLPYAEVTGGALLFPMPAAAEVLRAWRDWAGDAPESITTSWRMLHAPGEEAIVMVDGVALDPAAAAELDSRLRAAATPFAGGFGPMPAAAVARLHGDPEEPTPAISDGFLLAHLDDEAIERFLALATPDSPLVVAELRQLGGALSSAPAGAGARGSLEGAFLLFGLGAPGGSGSPEAIGAHLDRMRDALAPAATGTQFSSFTERPGGLAGTDLGRLRRLRAELDPDGVLVAPHLS